MLVVGMFGFGVAALYIVSGLSIAILAGTVLGRMRLERYVEPFVFETNMPTCADPAAGLQGQGSLPRLLVYGLAARGADAALTAPWMTQP